MSEVVDEGRSPTMSELMQRTGLTDVAFQKHEERLEALEVTSCSHCQEIIKDWESAVALSCLHVFCNETCLEEGTKNTSPDIRASGDLRCPMCSRSSKANDLGQWTKLAKEVFRRDAILFCSICTSGAPALFWCEECSGSLCQSCLDQHTSLRKSSKHKPILLNPVRHGRIVDGKQICPAHGLEMELFCKECKLYLCARPECLQTHRENQHEVKHKTTFRNHYEKVAKKANPLFRDFLERATSVLEDIEEEIKFLDEDDPMSGGVAEQFRREFKRVLQAMAKCEHVLRVRLVEARVMKFKRLNMKSCAINGLCFQMRECLDLIGEGNKIKSSSISMDSLLALTSQLEELTRVAEDYRFERRNSDGSLDSDGLDDPYFQQPIPSPIQMLKDSVNEALDQVEPSPVVPAKGAKRRKAVDLPRVDAGSESGEFESPPNPGDKEARRDRDSTPLKRSERSRSATKKLEEFSYETSRPRRKSGVGEAANGNGTSRMTRRSLSSHRADEVSSPKPTRLRIASERPRMKEEETEVKSQSRYSTRSAESRTSTRKKLESQEVAAELSDSEEDDDEALNFKRRRRRSRSASVSKDAKMKQLLQFAGSSEDEEETPIQKKARGRPRSIKGMEIPGTTILKNKYGIPVDESNLCAICREGRDEPLIECETCPNAFHLACHLPAKTGEKADVPFKCVFCTSTDEFPGVTTFDLSESNANFQAKQKAEIPSKLHTGKFIYACKFLSELFQMEEASALLTPYSELYQKFNGEKGLDLLTISKSLTLGHPMRLNEVEDLPPLLNKLFAQAKHIYETESNKMDLERVSKIQMKYEELRPIFFPYFQSEDEDDEEVKGNDVEEEEDDWDY